MQIQILEQNKKILEKLENLELQNNNEDYEFLKNERKHLLNNFKKHLDKLSIIVTDLEID